MAQTIQDIRQSQTRVLQDQLNAAATTGMDSTLASINSELTQPGRLIAAATPNYTVTIGSGSLINPNTSKNRVLPFINNTPVTFTGNTLTFPSTTAGGNISWTGGAVTITTVASSYYAVTVQLNSTGTLSLYVGAASGSISGISIPTGSSQALTLGYIICQTNSSNIIQPITNSMIYQMPLGSGGGGSSSGSGLGDDLDALQYQTDVYEQFVYNPSTSATQSTIDLTQSNATYSSSANVMTLSYDANKTVTGTGTAMTMSAAPAYTVAVGDILRVGTQARKITAVASQTSYTIESAFSTNPSASACCVSQAVYSKDLNNYAFNGVAISSIYSSTMSDCLVTYNDNTSGNSNYNYTDPSLIGYTASADGSTYTTVQSREANLSSTLAVTSLSTSGSNMYVRFFSNATSGAGTVVLNNYKVFFHRLSQTESGGILYQSLCFTNGVGTAVGCSNPTVVGGKTQIVLSNPYPVGVNSGFANGSLFVYLNGQKIPRYINATLTPDASYTEVNATTILLDKDYSTYNYSVETFQEMAVVDSNTQNTTNIAAMQSHQFQNVLINGAVDFWQRATTASIASGTPAYVADRWFCNNTSGVAATYSQTTGVINGSKYGASVVYGASATSSGLALTQVVENLNTLQLLGNQASVGVWVKGNGLTNQVTLSIGYATSETKTQTAISSQTFTVNSSTFTYCALAGVNIGTLPTSAGSISVSVSATGASSGNVYASGNGFVIEQAILNVGGSVAPFSRAGKNAQEELAMCHRYYEKSYDTNVVAGTADSALVTGRADNALSTSDFYSLGVQFYKVSKRTQPSVTTYSTKTGTSAKLYDQQAAADVGSGILQPTTQNFRAQGASSSLTAGHYYYWHWTADADI